MQHPRQPHAKPSSRQDSQSDTRACGLDSWCCSHRTYSSRRLACSLNAWQGLDTRVGG